MHEIGFEGQVAVVTRASKGLGRSIAILLASRGAKVVANDDNGPVSKVVEEIRQLGGVAVSDFNLASNPQKIFKTGLLHFGQVDILIHNAKNCDDDAHYDDAKESWLLCHAAFVGFEKQDHGRIVITTPNINGNNNGDWFPMGVLQILAEKGRKCDIHCNIATYQIVGGGDPETKFVASTVAYLSHNLCSTNGAIIDLTNGYAGQIALVNGNGVLENHHENDNVTIENVCTNWDKIVNLSHEKNSLTGLNFVGPLHYTNDVLKFEFGFTRREAVLYALTIGFSVTRSEEMKYLYENAKNFCVFPLLFLQEPVMFLVRSGVFGWNLPKKNVRQYGILLGEEYVEILGAVPTEGKVYMTLREVEVLDKVTASVIIYEVNIYNEQHQHVIRNQMIIFVPGCGDFGGPRNSGKIIPTISPPNRPPDKSVEYLTSLNQAALFRMNGDETPLHIDPQAAKEYGMEQPYLHGLCTFGICTRLVLEAFANCDSNLLVAVKARLSKPAMPGQTLRVDMWKEKSRIYYETIVKENNNVVVSGGYVDLKSVIKA